jgi:hypothetical protein
MANTFYLINRTILSSNSNPVFITGIPATYDDLFIVGSVRSVLNGSLDYLDVRLNNNGSSIYSNIIAFGTGTSTGTYGATNIGGFNESVAIAGANSTTGTFGSFEIYIPGYAKNQNKQSGVFAVQENIATQARTQFAAVLTRLTDPISVLYFASLNDNLLAGTTFWVYGIKNT